MKQYYKELEELFKEWEKAYNEQGKGHLFCKDGLMRIPEKTDEEIEKLWDEAPRRIVFMVKDSPDGGNDDVRNWLINPSNPKLGEQTRNLKGGRVGRSGFIPNIAKMFYGLLNLRKDNREDIGFQNIEKKENIAKVKDTWVKKPFAIVEAKKAAGGSSVHHPHVVGALTDDEEFLRKELDILQPNIIVCCDPAGSQFDFVTQKYMKSEPIRIEYKDEYKDKNNRTIDIDCCLYYYPKEKVVVIKSYHPTNLGKKGGKRTIYERVMRPFHKLMKDYPDINI